MKLGLGFCYWTPVRPKINLTSPSPQVIATQPWMKMNNFSMIAEVIDSAPGTNINNKVIFHMGDNSGIANRYVLYKANGDSDVDFYLSNASATVASTTRQWEILRASKKQRWGLSVKNGTIKLYLNGVKIDAWFDISVPTVASPVIGIGTQNSALDYTHANLTYNSFQFYDRALSETKMRQLTTTDDHDTSATYNPALKLIAVGGQSNAGGRASGSNTYTNGARMKLIRTQGGLVSYADPAAVNTSEIFSAFFW
ncbi:MAG: hypothetical protein LRZ85_05995 [Alphaproteobacteria bacterium]|nr:hypothetical protein [Alphaproteobacteria bacterium]